MSALPKESNEHPYELQRNWHHSQRNHHQNQHHHHHHHHRRQQQLLEQLQSQTASPTTNRQLGRDSTDPYVKNRYETWPDRWRPQPNADIVADRSDLPPYIKKYNRRQRKLIEALEQRPAVAERDRADFIAKVRAKQRSESSSNNDWLQANLFEQQKQKGKEEPKAKVQRSSNDLPEGKVPSYQSSYASTTVASIPVSAANRLNNFHFHRVAMPKQYLATGFDGSKNKPTLPFVAITDRRLTSAPAGSRNRGFSDASSSTSALLMGAMMADAAADGKGDQRRRGV